MAVVASASNRSGAARSNSRPFDVEERAAGYAVDGTPVDCVHYGRGYLDMWFDAVVSGCNDGPNFGAHRLERSGTVATAIEAVFLGVSGLAFSLSDHPDGMRAFDREDYELADRVAASLVGRVVDEGLPEDCDYLNVNVPADPPTPRLRLTEPTYDFEAPSTRRPGAPSVGPLLRPAGTRRRAGDRRGRQRSTGRRRRGACPSRRCPSHTGRRPERRPRRWSRNSAAEKGS